VQAAERAGVTVESVSPATISLSFEPAVTRLVPVTPRIQGRLAPGLALVTAVTANPQLVRVRGPVSRIAGLDSIGLQAFDLASITQSGVFTVPVDTAGLVGGSVVPSTVSLSVRVEELVERVFPGIVVDVEAGSGQPALVAEPQALEARITGPRSLVTGLDPQAVEAYVGAEFLLGMSPGEVRRVPVRIRGVPAGVTAEPVEETVAVRRRADVGRAPSGGNE
jgi:YbbR domain-containing protein